MFGKLRKIYRLKQLRSKLKVFHKQAVIGDMFEYGFLAQIKNEAGDRNRITIGHHSRLNGLLVCKSEGRIEMGNYSSIQDRARILCRKHIKIGHYVGIGDGTVVCDYDGIPKDAEERVKYMTQIMSYNLNVPDLEEGSESSEASPIIIEDVAWVGAGCVISKGVRLGEACIVARNAVVLSDVPPFTIVAGNPAKVVKELKKPDHPYYQV
jgi:acetyltransferase-like isoleucine patch superfamily enzyme